MWLQKRTLVPSAGTAALSRDAVTQHMKMLRFWSNVRSAGCNCSIWTEGRRSAKGRQQKAFRQLRGSSSLASDTCKSYATQIGNVPFPAGDVARRKARQAIVAAGAGEDLH